MNARAVSDEPNVAAENINAHLNLEGRRIVLTQLDADVNGGTLKGSGDITLGEGTLSDVNIQLVANDVAYDAPLDLRSISDSDIRITKNGDEILVSGKITIDEAGLTGDVNFDTGLLASMTARRKLDLTEERNPILERVRFNVDVNTATPILVDNNLARAEIESDLTVVGTPYETGLLGELTLLEGSEIRLQERRYETERGVLTFADERRILPSFDLRLNTTAGTYDITIAITGTPGDTETTLTSDPSLPEPDIMAMLVTGRTLDDMRGEEYEVARAQVLSYLAGRVGSSLGRGLQQATGLSEVRIEPTLIANEADPSARLTLGQELTDDLKLVYSTNLTDSNDQIWVAEYDVSRRFQTRGVRQEDSSYRLDFRHDVRFGGRPEPRRTQRTHAKVAEVAVTVPAGTDEAAVRKAVRRQGGRQLRLLRDSERHPARRGIARRAGLPAVARPPRARGRGRPGTPQIARDARTARRSGVHGRDAAEEGSGRGPYAVASRRLRQTAGRRWRGCAAGVVDGRQPPSGQGRLPGSGRRERPAPSGVPHSARSTVSER